MAEFTMFLEVLPNVPGDDPAQGLVKIETTRTNNFAGMGVHFGWVVSVRDDAVSLQTCLNRAGDAGDYLLHLNPAHIVSWCYADLTDLPR